MKGMIRAFLLICFFVGYFLQFSGDLQAQSSASGFRHYSLEDGLPSARVYRMIQDKEGFLWLATDAGVSRFDGKNFENFTTADGLGDNDIVSLVEDSWGRIWFMSYNGRLSYYYRGVIHNQETDEWLSHLENRSPIISFFIDSGKNLWFGTPWDGVIKIMGNNAEHFSKKNGFDIGSGAFFFENQEGRIYAATLSTNEVRNIKKNLWVTPFNFENNNLPGMFWHGKSQSYGSRNLSYSNDHILINDSTYIKTSIENPVGSTLNRLDWNGSDSIWVHSASGGPQLIENRNGKWIIYSKLLQGENTSSIVRDKEGGVWISTLTNGIFRSNGYRELSRFLEESGKMTDFMKDDKIWVSGVEGIFRFEFPEMKFRQVYQINSGNEIKAIKKFKDYLVFGQSSSLNFLNKTTQEVRRIDFSEGGYQPIKDCVVYTEDSMLVATNNGLFQFVGQDRVKLWPTDSSLQGLGVISICQVSENEIWLGSNDGLFILKNGKTINLAAINPLFGSAISCFSRISKNKLIVGSRGNGFFVFEGDKMVRQIKETDGLVNNFINKIRIEGEKAFICTNQGLSMFDLATEEIESFGDVKELSGGPIYDILVFGDTFLLAKPNGVLSLAKSEFSKPAFIQNAIITKVLVNDSLLFLDSLLELTYFENSISVYFNIISLNYAQNIEPEYSINNDLNWKYIPINRLDLISLSPGTYKISIRGKLKGTQQYSNTASITFIIHPPFWKTWWFFVLIGFVIIGIVFLILRSYLRSRARRENVLRRLTQSRLTALRSQMNPHFIFNSLNSIQNFVAQNDQKEAFLYLSRFGKLMRRVLDNSEEDQIPVEEEVETLRLYLQLEQLRANNFFDFEIKISDNIEADYHRVPPTLIQPMLENAIWHGVMHRQTKGLIELGFELEDDTIICIVRDNGVGREKARTLEELNKKDHKSKGLSITRERLVLLNDRRKNQIALEILDLTDSAGECIGTEVVLKIPV